MDDRRRNPRVLLTVAVTMEIGDKIIRGAGCRNVSLNGMLVAANVQLNIDEIGVVSFTQKCGSEIVSVVTGFRVARLEPISEGGISAFGLEFLQIDTHNFQNLSRIVAFHQHHVIR